MLDIKKEVNDLLRKTSVLLVTDKDITEAIEFVGELMDLMRIHTEQDSPHATRSIQEMKQAYYHIRSLEEWMDEQSK
jgi:hypothetical protein